MPTTEQIQWFWEQIGWKFTLDGKFWRVSPEASGWGTLQSLPTLDLNNLFKYAVPRVDVLQVILQPETDGTWYCGLCVDSDLYEATDKDSALALFWAIHKALGGNDEVEG